MALPPELAQDVTVFDEELPSLEELGTIVLSQYSAAGADPPAPATLNKAVDAVCGLAAFPAEQCTAMSFVRRSGQIPPWTSTRYGSASARWSRASRACPCGAARKRSTTSAAWTT